MGEGATPEFRGTPLVTAPGAMTVLFSARLPLAGFLVSATLVARQPGASIRLSVPSALCSV